MLPMEDAPGHKGRLLRRSRAALERHHAELMVMRREALQLAEAAARDDDWTDSDAWLDRAGRYLRRARELQAEMEQRG